jgi:hypothetical protein
MVASTGKHALKRIAIMGGVLLIAAFAIGILQREAIVEHIITKALSDQGVKDAEFSLSELSYDGLEIKDVRLGSQIGVEKLVVDFSLPELIKSRLQRIEISGLSVDLSKPETGILGRIMEAIEGSENNSAPPGPFPHIRISEARAYGSRKGLAFSARIDATINPDLSALLMIDAGGQFKAEGRTITAQDIRADIALERGAQKGRITLTNASLEEVAEGASFPPAKMSGQATFYDGKIDFETSLSVVNGLGKITASGAHDLVKNHGAASLALSPLVFKKGGLQPRDLSAKATAIALDGTISGNASITWGGESGADGKAAIELSSLSFKAGEAAVRRLSATLDIATLERPENLQIKLKDATATINAGAEEVAISGVNGLAEIDNANAIGLKINGKIGGIGDFLVNANHNLESGEGQAALSLPGLAFATPGAQPSDLSGLLKPFENVSGSIKGNSLINWTHDKYDGSTALILDGLSFSLGTTTFEKLSGTLRLDQINPPQMSAVQEFSAARITDALSLENPVIRFKLEDPDKDERRIHIEYAAAEIGGGLIFVRDVTIGRTNAKNHLTLEISNIDLEKLMGLLNIDGVSGSGLLGGSIPLEVSENEVSIKDGLLEAAGTGVLHIRSEQARQALFVGGEQVELLLQVLEDFRYTRLSLSLNRSEKGATRIQLKIEGSNPAVKDGHPFILNISLSGSLDEALASVLEAYRLSGRALKATLDHGL